MAGYGWNISGLSSITRIQSTKFHDGEIDAIDFDGLDRFSLDGQRLIKKDGGSVYGASGTEYQTENFSNLKITSYGVSPFGANYGPAYFVVLYPDGSIAHYGNSSNSRSYTDWAITYWQNAQGARISYDYLNENNTLSIASIKYGALLGNQAINEVRFEYVQRQRPEQAYIADVSLLRTKILKEIKVVGNGVGFRNYSLAYGTTSLAYERLVSVTEKSGDSQSALNPTIFSYLDTPKNIAYNQAATTGYDLQGVSTLNGSTVPGDFDGDGKMDFLLYPTFGDQAKKKFWVFQNILGQSTYLAHEVPVGKFEEIFSSNYLDYRGRMQSKQGITTITNQGPSTGSVTFNTYAAAGGSVSLHERNSKVLVFPTYNIGDSAPTPNLCNYSPYKAIPKRYFSGDFNGDGITDVIAVEMSSNFTKRGTCQCCDAQGNYYSIPGESRSFVGGKSYFIDLDTRLDNTAPILTDSYTLITGSSKVYVADADGDGKSELYVFNDGKAHVYTLNSNNQLVPIWSYFDSKISVADNSVILVGDYNGDGKADFLVPPPADGSTTWYKYLSTGKNFSKVTENYVGINFSTGSFGNNNRHWIATDFDNDGKTDLLKLTASRTEDNTLGGVSVTLFNNRNGIFAWTAGNSYTVSSPVQADINQYAMPIFYSSAQPNRKVELGFINNSKVHFFQSQQDFGRDRLLRSITTGNGVTDEIAYHTLTTDAQNVYAHNGNYEYYPNIDITSAGILNVVSKIENRSAAEYKKQLYYYNGAISNAEGLGFLGFRSTMQTSWHNDSHRPISIISKFDMQKRGALIEKYSVLDIVLPSYFSPSPSSYVDRTVLTYNELLFPNKMYKRSIDESFTYNGLSGTSTETKTYYDDFNNPVSNYVSFKEGTNLHQLDVTLTEYENQASSGNYYIGRPYKKNTTSFGTTQIDSEELYSYGTSNLLLQIKKKGHNTDYLTEDIEYDNFGNVAKSTVSSPGSAARVNHYEYDPSGRFLKKATDIEGLVTLFEHDSFTGQLKSETDPYGKATSYRYDKWGKKNSITNYLGTEVEIQYTKPEPATAMIKFIGDDESSSLTKYDDLGREIVSGAKQINGEWSYTKTDYDIYGRKIKVGEPVVDISATPIHYSETTFDEYGRLLSYTNPAGITDNFEYNGLRTTTNGYQKITEVTKNAVGRVVSKFETGIDDMAGTISYEYYPDGNLKKTVFDGNEISIEQDGWGRKTKMTDPSAGTYEYYYNAFGEIIKEITPNGTTEFILDDAGKTLQKTISGPGTNSISTYTFDPATKLLTSSSYQDLIEGLQPTTYNYGYDRFGRLNFTDESGPLAYYQQAITFDYFGRPEKELYSAVLTANNKRSDKWIQNIYKNGYRWKILDQATQNVLWQTDLTNERGQLVNGLFGNGIKISNAYDQYGLPQQAKHWANATVGPVITENRYMDISYQFDTYTGNLTSRNNNIALWNEEFEYDSLDRLTSYKDIDGSQQQQYYDNKGRITQNNLGGYRYHATKTYQNTSIELDEKSTAYYANRLGLFNDGMESQQGWTTYWNPNYESFDTFSHTGKYSLKVRNDSADEKIVFSEKHIPINNAVATQYTYSAWVYSDGPQSEMFLYMKTAGETGLYSLAHNVISNDTGTWKLIEGTFLVPANIKSLSIRLDNNGGTGNVWFDNVHIRKTNSPVSSQRELNISYNAFKGPVMIEETGVDKISFAYNDAGGRSAMYWGGLQDNKFERQYRKHYSMDGSMEIKYNTLTQETEFVTYIGGDGYSAPVVLKSDGASEEYLYLHRDYQGSILAITDQARNVVESRLFDAWGNIVRIQDGSGNILTSFRALDRGYTGHEHLLSVGLIHMNARLYDPKLHRFLQPDNFVQDPGDTQNYNRYGYVLNNPLRYADPTGETGEESGGGGISESQQSAIGNSLQALVDNWDSLKIKDWAKKNLNVKEWGNGLKSAGNWFGNNAKSVGGWFENQLQSLEKLIYGNGNNTKFVRLPASEFSNTQSTNNWQQSGFVDHGTISMPTQHSFLGINMTALSQGNFLEQTAYGIANGFNIPVQYLMGRGVGDGSMRNLDGTSTSTDEGVMAFGTAPLWFMGGGSIAGTGGGSVAGTSEQGGLNLFKWGAEQTGQMGWKSGDYMLHLPNKGSVKLNWKSNYGALRREMSLNKRIFDSYRMPNGNLIPTGGFLNAERYILQSRGWIYNARQGAWLPPLR